MAFNALWDLLHRQAILFGILTTIISPFLTYYITTSLFYKKARSSATKKAPPTVPYCVPGIFHAFSLASIGPQKYFAWLVEMYGDFAPFYVNAGPQSFLVVRDWMQVSKILKATEDMTQEASRIEVFDKILGSPQATLDIYALKDVSEMDKYALKHAHVGLTREHLSGRSLSKNVEGYVSILSDNLNDKMFQVGSWTQIEDSWSFLQQVITRCILASLFGTDLLKQYPGVIKDYWQFSDAVEGFVPGMPRYWVPGAASPVRDRLHCGIEKWLKANHSGSEFARITAEDPTWDSFRGSKFIQERDDVLAKIEGMDMKGRAAEMLSVIHEVCSTLVPCAFWTLLEVIHKPTLAKTLTTNINRHCASRDAVHNIAGVIELPLIQSIQAEVKRLRMATLEVFNNEVDGFALDAQWSVRKGTPIVLFSHDISMNPNVWEMVQPRTVQRPLEEFWAERFLLPEKSSAATRIKGKRDGVVGGSYTMDHKALSLLLGNNSYQTLGKEYVEAIQAATLAVLLNGFEIQLCEPETFDVVVPPPREVAFGILKPIENVAVRIRKRALAEQQ